MVGRRWFVAVSLGFGLVVTGCASQTGPDPSALPAEPGTAPPSGQGQSAPATEELVTAAASEYKAYVGQQIDQMVSLTTTFTDAVRAGDLAAAQAAYAPSRVPWERIEPIAGLVEEIDGKVDARVDDFASVDDPAWTGWHRLEYLLFEKQTTEGAAPFADQLDADLATLQSQFATLEVPPVAVATGAAELIEEVSTGKITGEEDRYSKTDLWDFAANVEGSQAAIRTLEPALQQANPDLLARINDGFAELNARLAPLRDGDGWKPYCLADDEYPSPICGGRVTVPPETVDELKAQLAGLSENLSQVAGALSLQ